MAGGDRFEVDLTLGAGARLLLTSAAAEKVYRSNGPDTTVSARFKVAPGGTLTWLPQETILFDQSRLRRSIEVDLAGDARMLLAESIIFGRTGMGEVVAEGLLHDRWRVRRDGRLLHAEAARLDGPISQRLARTAIANGSVAVATILLVPGNEETVAAVRAASQQSRGEIGASSWNGLTVIRLVASDGAALRDDLLRILTAIRGGKLPRLWLH
jgi:urease accessory protein